MKKKKETKVYYYSDELKDDFATIDIKPKKLADDYEYIPHNPFRKFVDFLIYYIIAYPVVLFYQKCIWHEKIINKKAVKPYKKGGYFLYGNHTRNVGDAFGPNLICYPKKGYIITNNDSAANPFIRFFTKSLGNLPLPSGFKGFKAFHKAVIDRVNQNKAIIIYPEAHIWPYYTKIRPFVNNSFHYPAESKKPVFTFTVTYQKRKHSNKPKTTMYIDGPFFAKDEYTLKENQQYLRDLAYEAMVKRSEMSTYEYVKYVKKENS